MSMLASRQGVRSGHEPGAGVKRLAFVPAALVLITLLSACGGSAQQTDAQRAAVLLNAGIQAHSAGRLAEAATDYHKVLVYDPRNVWAYYNLGVIDQIAGNSSSAEQDYRAALTSNPDLLGALYNLAILRTTAAPQEAIDLYRHAISVSPNAASAHLNLGFLLISMGQQAEGKAELDRAVAIDPAMATRIPVSVKPTPSPGRKP
jgi:tetratricopeptide (TPR) repeat protein